METNTKLRYVAYARKSTDQEEKQITFEVLKNLIITETQKVLNFSSKQWSDKIEKSAQVFDP